MSYNHTFVFSITDFLDRAIASCNQNHMQHILQFMSIQICVVLLRSMSELHLGVSRASMIQPALLLKSWEISAINCLYNIPRVTLVLEGMLNFTILRDN